MQTHITAIAAITNDHGIGKDNSIPWHLPDDFKRFKLLTTGNTIIMGRKTFESFPKPLPNRKHIVISRNPNYRIDHHDCIVVDSITDALLLCKNEYEVFIIGGGEIYEEALKYCTKCELTVIDDNGKIECDAFFPDIDTTHEWILDTIEYHDKDEKHAYEFAYKTYIRNEQYKQACQI